MSPELIAVLLASAMGAIAHAVGILLVQSRHEWTKRNAIPLTAFAGGVVVATAIVHLLPEATERMPSAAAWALVSFLCLYLLESHFVGHAFHHHPHEEEHDHDHELEEADHAYGFLRPAVGIMTVVGFVVHTIFDGLAIGAGFHEGVELGITSAFAVLAHELPEGIATYALVTASGFSRKAAMATAWGIAAIDPVVAVVTFGFLQGGVADSTMGAIFALIAGSFLYIGASDLLPEVGRRASVKATVLLLLGVLTIVAGRFLLHSH